MHFIKKDKSAVVFIILAAIFLTNAILAEFIGVKIFSFEKTFGIQPMNISIFGIDHLSFNLTTGVLIWPVVFVLTDIINEYFGPKGVRFLSYLAASLILYAFLVIWLGIRLVPADFWPTSHLTNSNSVDPTVLKTQVSDLNVAFRLIFGQGLWIIIGSLVAFLVSQILDVFIFHKIKAITGERAMWLRSTGSTLISQLIDSFVVLFIAFYIGAGWSFTLVLAICTVNYIYKFLVALLMTPVIYVVHHFVDRYLGDELASELKISAMGES